MGKGSGERKRERRTQKKRERDREGNTDARASRGRKAEGGKRQSQRQRNQKTATQRERREGHGDRGENGIQKERREEGLFPPPGYGGRERPWAAPQLGLSLLDFRKEAGTAPIRKQSGSLQEEGVGTEPDTSHVWKEEAAEFCKG